MERLHALELVERRQRQGAAAVAVGGGGRFSVRVGGRALFVKLALMLAAHVGGLRRRKWRARMVVVVVADLVRLQARPRLLGVLAAVEQALGGERRALEVGVRVRRLQQEVLCDTFGLGEAQELLQND